jgi:type II secretory pathway component PulK
MNRHRRSERHGFFLVLVLIVVAVATMAVYSFTELMVAYDDAAYLSGDLVQARVNVESAAEAIRLTLAQPPDARDDLGGVFNNPQLFQAVTVTGGIDGTTLANYTVLAPGVSPTVGYAGIRFGLQDESARLNVNTLTVLEKNSGLLSAGLAVAGVEASSGSSATDEESSALESNLAVTLLMALPGMTEDIADAILDWLDEDTEPRTYGAEAEYYNALPTPCSPANGPLQSVEELLLVRGVTPNLLFGADVNRNGVIDADEQQRFGVTAETPGAFGWAAYLTVHGAEANRRRDGDPRVNVNQDDLELLYDELSEALGNDLYASYIVAYRIAGQTTSVASALTGASQTATGGGSTGTDSSSGGSSSGRSSSGGSSSGSSSSGSSSSGSSSSGSSSSGSSSSGGQAQDGGPWLPDLLSEMDLTGGGGTSFTQILDLIDSTVTIGEGDQARSYTSPFPGDPIAMSIYMPILMDALTTQDAPLMPGRLNLNECPAELLYGIPLLDEETVQAIVENREVGSDDLNRRFETWPLVEGLVTLDQMRLLLPLLTGGGDVYRAQIVGYFENSGVSHRAEVVINATSVNPKVVAWRDLSHLGRGFDLSVLGLRSSLGVTP